MPTYANRPTRFNLKVPVSFHAAGELVHGQTLNVSAGGLLVVFRVQPELWVSGRLAMFVDDYQLSIPAKVARLHERFTGMAFVPVTDNDRRSIQIVVDFASASMKPGEQVRYDF